MSSVRLMIRLWISCGPGCAFVRAPAQTAPLQPSNAGEHGWCALLGRLVALHSGYLSQDFPSCVGYLQNSSNLLFFCGILFCHQETCTSLRYKETRPTFPLFPCSAIMGELQVFLAFRITHVRNTTWPLVSNILPNSGGNTTISLTYSPGRHQDEPSEWVSWC